MNFQDLSRSLPSRLVIGAVASSMALVLSGCGSSGESAVANDKDLSPATQQCVANANEYLEARGLLPESLPKELLPLSKAPTEGLTITRLFPGSVPSSVAHSEQIVKDAGVLGWVGKALAYDGSVEDVNRKFLEAIEYSDVVVVDGIPPAAVQQPIKAAKEKGVLLMLGAVAEEPESVPGYGGSALGGDLYPKLGELAAYAVMQASNCQANVATFGLPYDAMHNLADGMAKVLEEECEECAYSYTDIADADIGSPAATNAVVSKLQSDPSINFTFFTIGDLAAGMEPAMKQAGLDAQISGAIATPANLAALKKGDNSFWLGLSPEINAWMTLDTAARALDSGEPTIGNHVPWAVFTPENIETTDPMPYYPADYAEQFKKLWQVN